MDGQRFDSITKAIVNASSRRQLIRGIAGSAVAGALALVGAGNSADARRCRVVGQNCRSNAECCERFCDTETFQCACPTGTNLCVTNPPRQQCLAACTGGRVFDPETCECECRLGAQPCPSPGGACCPISQGFRCCPEGCRPCLNNGQCRNAPCTPGGGGIQCCSGVCIPMAFNRGVCA